MNRSTIVKPCIAFLSFALCLPLQAWQGNNRAATDASGQTTVSTYDESGKLMLTVDGTGTVSRPGAQPSSLLASPAPVKTQAAVSPLAPVTINVPANQPTIQGAINAANDGDTVLVSDGTYTENINFNGKAITVTSMNGAATTIIDGGAIDSVVTFRTNEAASSVLNGFTIRNGFSNFSKPNFGAGGGVFIGNASPTITNNVITKNQGCDGAGIFTNGGGPLIQGNVISNNSQAGCSGGNGGGGIGVLGSSGLRIIGNTIVGNSNTSSGVGGGGIGMNGAGAPLIQGNIISSNNGGTQGGGIGIVNDASPQIVNNLFIHNTASSGGGLWWLIPTSTPGILLLNNTITDNTATQGSGIFADGFDSNAVFQNNAIIGTPGVIAAFCGDFNNTVPPNFVNDDVFTTGATPYGGICTDQTGKNGNISSDPLFVDPAVDNYHLQTTSPAIDGGNNTAAIPLPTTDLDGNPRVVAGTVDIGAFEFQGGTTAGYSATSLTFGPQQVGTTSPAQDFIISNGGSVALQLVPFTFTGNTADFTVTDNCHDSHGVLPGNGCTVFVTFSPTARFTRSAQINIVSNDTAGTKTINLTGTGIAPVVNLSTTSLSFSNQLVGTNSSSQAVTLMNVGDGALTITSIVASGDFSQTNNCGTSVAAHGGCTISVTFSPTQRGTRNGALTISDDAADSPHVVSLQGNGIGPAAALSGGLTFAGQLVGTTSAAQPVTLSSTGETALTINGISASGDFGQTNNCPGSLPNGQSCTIQVTFTPTARGTRSGTLTVTDNSTTSPEQVNLSGQGTAPVVALSRTSLAFGNQVLDVPVTGTVILNNTGDAALSVTSITAGGDFSQNNDCGTSVAVQAHCTVTVTFQPTALGARLGTLTFTDSASDSPQTVTLSGTGVQIAFSPSSLAFGNQVVGTTSATQAVTVTNLGNSALSITSIVASAGFTQTNNCGTSLAGNASCTLNVAFAPTSAGPVNGLVTVSYNGTQSTIVVTGNGTDFSLGPQAGGSTTATVTAGSTAAYNLSLNGTSGSTGAVNLTCSGAPQAASCSDNPTSVNLNGTTPANFTVTVTTTARGSALPANWRLPEGCPLPLLLGTIVAMVAIALRKFRRRRARQIAWAAGFALLLAVGCGGGGSTRTPQQGTPAGTYTIIVTATSGSANRTLNLTLNVQ